MGDKNAVALLYEYCQDKSTAISLADLKFEYDINQFGLFKCVIYLNGEKFDKGNSYSKSKKAAKNEIAAFVYEKLKEQDSNNNIKEQDDNRNAVAKLNEYCQDKNTKINLTDLIFDYEINSEGYFNCKVRIHDKVYDKNLSCKSKKVAKNEIAQYVYNCLTEGNKKSNIFNEKINDILSKNKIQVDVETQECGNEKYMCLIQFKNINKFFIELNPKTINEINESFLSFLVKDKTIINEEEPQEIDTTNYSLNDYATKNEIPLKYVFEKTDKYLKCIISSLDIVIGEYETEITKNEKDIKKLCRKIAKKEALSNMKKLINKEALFPPYKNDIDLNLDKKIFENGSTEIDNKANNYIQNITQNFISLSSKKEEKKYLNEINNNITEIMNRIKKDNHISGSYVIKKINSYEVWNIINYEIILFIEFKIEYFKICLDEIYKKLESIYEDKIIEINKVEEQEQKKEKVKINPYKMRMVLNNGCTFCIYIGSNIYDTLLTKQILPFKACLDIERKYIQFVILWSNLILYQDLNNEPEEGFDVFLKEQEKIFTTLALYSWDYTIKMMDKYGKRRSQYIISFTNLIYMLIHYKSLDVCWYDSGKKGKTPNIIEPISNRNLITSKNEFMWNVYSEYAKTIYNDDDKKIKLFVENQSSENNGFKLLFQPFIKYPNYFKAIRKIYFRICEDNKITVKSALYHISKELENKKILNIIFNSLQSFLLLNIYNTENSIEIQNLNNEKNDAQFKELNKRLKEELKQGIKKFFECVNSNIKVKNDEKRFDKKRKDISNLFFFLGNNNNVSIDVIVKFE